ncbi:MAG TPA: hypothetical protein PKD61_19410 [Polyangiaceae bacterium]|nr:hypothetical protein [Polyangiaceae bacterium]
MRTIRKLAAACTALFLGACTIPASKQALWTSGTAPPSDAATFVEEEDSGLSLFGLIQFTEPDHFAVLMERARKRNRCAKLHHAQLDYFMDHWVIVAFPIARITEVCEPQTAARSQVAKSR